jgi:cell division protease FtsH
VSSALTERVSFLIEGYCGFKTDRLGLVTYERARQPTFLPTGFTPGKTYSEEKAGQIDEEVTRVIEEAHQRVRGILSAHRNVLDDLARLVSQKEVVQGEELRKMLGKTPVESSPTPEGI